eukprot:gene26054-31457_t
MTEPSIPFVLTSSLRAQIQHGDTYLFCKKAEDCIFLRISHAFIVTLDSQATSEMQRAPGLIIESELEVHKDFVQPISRAKRKLPRPPTDYPIRKVSFPGSQGCQWLAITEEWDLGRMDSLPFYRKQVFEVFQRLLDQHEQRREGQVSTRSVVLLDSHVNGASSRVLLLLALLCGYLHDEPQLPLHRLSTLPVTSGNTESSGAAAGSDGNVVLALQVDLETWAPGCGNGFGGLRGAALANRVAERLQALLALLGWEFSLSAVRIARLQLHLFEMLLHHCHSHKPVFEQATQQFVTRLTLSIAKDREQGRGISSVSSRVLASSLASEARAASRRVKSRPSAEQGWSVFEFFSGIGGVRLALPDAIDSVPIRRIRAFDCSAVPNMVYEHNFHGSVEKRLDSVRDSSLRNILVQGLKVRDVDGQADIWTMSPPCQPYTTTRGALRRDHLDNRSRGLMHLISLLLQMQQLPRFLFVENVQGFVGSNMHACWQQCMQVCGYHFEEFVLSPHRTAGLPNSRSRYYFVGWLPSSDVSDPKGEGHQGRAVVDENAHSQLLSLLSQMDASAAAGSASDAQGNFSDDEDADASLSDDEDSCSSERERHMARGIQQSIPGARRYEDDEVCSLNSLLSLPSAQFPATCREQLLVPAGTLAQPWAAKSMSVATRGDRLTY